MEDRALRQLLWIKWILVGVVLVIAIPMMASAWFMSSAFSELNSYSTNCGPAESEKSFKDQAGELLLSGKEQEVLKLASAREPQFPKDPDVHYFRARAYFQAGDYQRALESFAVAESIAPGWRDQYIGPYAREAKRRLANPGSSGNSPAGVGAELPADDNEAYQQQLMKATEQQQRMDRLLTVQEQQAKRFGAVLDRWERQSGSRAP